MWVGFKETDHQRIDVLEFTQEIRFDQIINYMMLLNSYQNNYSLISWTYFAVINNIELIFEEEVYIQSK